MYTRCSPLTQRWRLTPPARETPSPRRRPGRLLSGTTALVCAVHAFGACAEGDPQTPRYTHGLDSSGTPLILTNRPIWSAPIQLPTTGRIAAIQGSSEAAVIGAVSHATRLGSGNIVIADGQARQLLEFSPSGNLVRIIGTEGEGPGEFRALGTLSRLPGDTVVVYDPRLRRLSYFPPDGGLVRYVTLQLGGIFSRVPMDVWALGGTRLLVLEGGSMHQAAERPTDRPTVFGPPAVLRVVDPVDGSSQVVFEGGWASETIQSGSTFWQPPFGRTTRVAVATSGHVALTTAASHTVLHIDPDSWNITSISAFPAADHRLTAAEVSNLYAQTAKLEAEANARFRTPAFLFEPELQPELRPAFSGLVTASNHFVLARVFAPGRQRSPEWWVVGPDGSFWGRVLVPGSGDILEIGDDYLIGLVRDQHDVPTVEVHAINWHELRERDGS